MMGQLFKFPNIFSQQGCQSTLSGRLEAQYNETDTYRFAVIFSTAIAAGLALVMELL